MTDFAQAGPRPGFLEWLKVLGWFYVELLLVIALAIGGTWLGPFVGGGVLAFGLLYLPAQLARRLWKLRRRGAELWAFGAIAVCGVLFFQFVMLFAISAPAFLRYQARARQAEARIALAQIYAAETMHQAEKNSYSNDLAALSYTPDGDRRNYYVGFPLGCVPSGADHAVLSGKGSPMLEGREAEIAAFFGEVRKPGECKELHKGFEAFAVGVLRKGGPLDVWRIDETKALENVESGL